MRKLPARKLLGSVIAAAFFMPQNAYTLGLGEIEVNSALNQRLNADIELLSASPEDVETVIVKLAPRKEFTRAGLDRPYLLNDLRFKAETVDGEPRIKVSSSSPIREPYLSFLVEIDWPDGHMLREYTVLLDPPVFMTQQAAAPAVAQTSARDSDGFRPSAGTSTNVVPVAAPSVDLSSRPGVAEQGASDRFGEPEAAAPVQYQPQARTAPGTQVSTSAFISQQPQSINQPAGTYKIKAGDTAWSLADAMRPDQSVSVEQMMLALLRTNPESFINDNINGLKRGYILRVPDYDEIMAVNQEEARAITREHAALWAQYQQTVAGGTPASAMEAGSMMDSEDAALGGDMPGDDAYLEIVSAGGGSTLGGKDPTAMSAAELRAELAIARERVETERVEKEALQQRVDTLEGRVDKMKGMLSIEDSELAEVQSLNMPDEGMADDMSADEAAMEAEADMAEPDMAESGMAESDMIESGMTPEEDGAIEDLDGLAEMAEGLTTEGLEEDAEADMSDSPEGAPEDMDMAEEGEAVFVDESAEAMEEAGMEETGMAEEPAAQPEPVRKPAPVVSQQPSDPLSRLLNDPMMLAAAGGALLLIAALITLLIKRRKSAEPADEGIAPLPDSGDSLEDLADDVASVVEDEEVQVDSLSGDETIVTEPGAGEKSPDFDSDSTMILDSAEDTVVAEPGESPAESEEGARDDVIAEADVYLAYGIYQQAEELLGQAISDNPDRDDYRVKLAETHYAAKNKEGFTAVATELKSRLDDDSPMWKKVLGMGQDLCADDALFQGSMVGVPAAAMAPDEPSMDFDLGVDEPAAEPAPDLDLSLDEPLELPEDESSEADSGEDDGAGDLEFDLSEAEAVEETDSAAADDGFSLDIDASELEIETDDSSAAAGAAEEEAIDIGDLELGLEDAGDEASDDGLDFSLDDGGEAAPAEESAEVAADDMALDLSEEAGELDMDLGDAQAEEPAAEEPAAEETEAVVDLSDSSDDEGDIDLSSLDDVDEVSTKLDLARAYLDMGDHEGTRGILDEVLAEGNEEQKKEANELLAKLE